MPRPRKKVEQARRHVVKFLLTAAEYAALSAQALSAGMDVNDYARTKATGRAARRLSASPAEPPGTHELRQQLIRVGVNMNQIARQLNMTGEHEPAELQAASQHLERIFERILADVTFH